MMMWTDQFDGGVLAVKYMINAMDIKGYLFFYHYIFHYVFFYFFDYYDHESYTDWI